MSSRRLVGREQLAGDVVDLERDLAPAMAGAKLVEGTGVPSPW
ncbi:hypothetical protein [Micromonospora taraxaci]